MKACEIHPKTLDRLENPSSNELKLLSDKKAGKFHPIWSDNN